MSDELITAGMDVGSSAVKTAVIRSRGDSDIDILSLRTDRIRRRDLKAVITESYGAALEESHVRSSEIAYMATTGDGELVEFRRGHFYGMTTHARGASFLIPEAAAVLDIGALHARAMRIDSRSKVLAYRMTSQCASGSGQFLENVARYLGITLEDVGSLSCSASSPEMVSSICAVLAETDVINMVSRGITTADIVKGIHLSMAGRYVNLLRSIGAEGTVVITGGLAADAGLAKALREKSADHKLPVEIRSDPRSIFAGAMGAALWGAYRHRVLARRSAA
jgi:benzoyl-CoA reductase subunit D